jgi:signal transduction histidine kinase
MAVPLRRAERRQSAVRPNIRLAALRVPLAAKLVGANLGVIAILLGAWLLAGGAITAPMAVLLGLVIVLHLGLTVLALRPIRDLEDAAARVWHGDFGARVDRSALADDDVLRVGTMFNLLLDGLAADRTRMRTLAAEVIATGDRDRAQLAYELHDNAAQQAAALVFELSAAARDCSDPELAKRLAAARDIASELTSQMRNLAQNVHPRVLDDLGLSAALRKLARDASNRSGVVVDAQLPSSTRDVPPQIASALYRVAEESVRNALRHGDPRSIHLSLELEGSQIRLEVRDDGVGFDPSTLEQNHRVGGVRLMRDRLALLDGHLDVRTAPNGGTVVIATLPLAGEANGKPTGEKR